MTQAALVTGASSGIGKETAKALAARGWHVIAHGRDPERSASAEAEIRTVATGRVDMLRADIARLADAARLADEVARLTDRLDLLVNNAGGTRATLVITSEGNEATFAGNHLGHFLITNRLLPLLRAAGAARVVSVSSSGHHSAPEIDWHDLQQTANWVSGKAYCQAKLFNILFTRALQRRVAGDGIDAIAMQPGVVLSNFKNHCTPDMKAYMETLDGDPPEETARSLLWLGVDAPVEAVRDHYFEKREVVTPSAPALDTGFAERLWDESERLIAKAGF
jgi:NAD(P)-dependent dehydrogenase (short-subunit alcohol dehydrogenase family)